ncbi:sarcosine oxidase subunit delta [Xanthobacter flavus]|uniref:Sarcosine oxidase subunit delta n=1 Tax=Xanthobacter flavus TaxID=281 RepID=A0A9W6CNQ9_XANFL|nr:MULTISPECIES: sarcosine oxidase subunit delta [Xanthobacter]MDR6334575.1 sarcosine oxidase subunit delta [Xanthobacter flavus]NMN56913.1 sarcosine oxidase subunit delta [Xanthobacter sp. SG618]UDQ89327.1 sarcosine oxidase subunit delta [Xanthobacter autotrophicus]GLI23406.1 sarcosine oxidase subunit delta [Xanthobacter flavus]
MRITCPYCGARSSHEFAYLGDAAPTRPDPADPEAPDAFNAYVYERDNVAGVMDELWYHAGGCRRWLTVTRDTRTHAITAVRFTTTRFTGTEAAE